MKDQEGAIDRVAQRAGKHKFTTPLSGLGHVEMFFAVRNAALDKIIAAIRRVLSGNIYVSEALGAKMLQQQIRGKTDLQESPVKSLSDRELEVFQLIGQWKKTSEIAQELHLSVKTIEYYREQIKHKLNLKNSAELTQHATAWVQRELPT